MLRRDFVKTSALVASALLTPVHLFAAVEKIKIAVLGTGWWGTDILLDSLLRNPEYEVVALCDVNQVNLKRAADIAKIAMGREPQLFSSYKQMYELPGLQAVVISTPTHWHPLQFIDACKKGLHVFLEKPISYDIREGLAMLEAHKKAKNVVVVDFPRTMVDTNGKVKDLIKNGEIGKVLQVQANIHNMEGDIVEKAIPGTIDYEKFCGPAPKLKYMASPDNENPNWRQQYGFSRGIMADWGIHYIHNARQVLGLGVPDRVSAIGGTVRIKSTDNPDYLDVRFDFGDLPVHWTHRAWGFTSPNPANNIGVFYYGEKGTIFAGDLGYEIYYPDGTKKAEGNPLFQPDKPEVWSVYKQMFTDIFNELATGIRNNSAAGITNTIEEAQRTTSTVIYGDMAFRTGNDLVIDTATFDVKNNKAARGLLKRPYRAPYQHPG